MQIDLPQDIVERVRQRASGSGDTEANVINIALDTLDLLEQDAKFKALKQAINEGLESGRSEKTIPDIMENVEARLKTDGRL